MQITPIFSMNYSYKNKSQTKPLCQTFTGYKNVTKIADKKYLGGIVSNYTTMFRNKNFMNEFPEFLHTFYPKGVKIYDYACSCGNEPYSLVMSMVHRLGMNKSLKYFPIKAFDICDSEINQAKKGYVNMDSKEISDVKSVLKDDFYALMFKLNNDLKNKDFKNKFLVKPEITLNVDFEQGDLLEKMKEKNPFKEPVVVLFRNAWQFLTNKSDTQLVKNLSEKLPNGSSVVIGDMDLNKYIDKELQNNGFKEVENPLLQPYVFIKDKLKEI